MTKAEDLLEEIRDTLRNQPIAGVPVGDDRRFDFFPTNRQSKDSYLLVHAEENSQPSDSAVIYPLKNDAPESDGVLVTIAKVGLSLSPSYHLCEIMQSYKDEKWFPIFRVSKSTDFYSFFIPLKNIKRVRITEINNQSVLFVTIVWMKLDIQGTG